MGAKASGTLIVIGGNEDKEHDCVILHKVVEMAGGREARIAVITAATEYPREVGDEYRTLFHELGAASAGILYISNRAAANDRHLVTELETATGIFFTGGDQLRLTSMLGGSKVDRAIRRAYERGIVIAGTSAGASAMSDTMIVEGDSSDTAKKCTVNMAHGMGLLEEVVIDQHFAQRGRINRLMTAVAQNPFVLGMGIDEDTAVVVTPDAQCEIIGSQTVTIIDGNCIIHSNVSESKPDDPLALTNVMVHILPAGFGFDLVKRIPISHRANQKMDPEDAK